ncbi:hypothetical protein DIPPA_03683 [Diplonema papillatum]|nr:hypothetical protein DIPPA_03683 [Diplonema papillatum]
MHMEQPQMKRATASPVQQKPRRDIRVQEEPLAEPVHEPHVGDAAQDKWQCLIARTEILLRSKEDPKLAAEVAELEARTAESTRLLEKAVLVEARREAKEKYETQALEAETKAQQDAEEAFSILHRDAKMLRQLDATRAATLAIPAKMATAAQLVAGNLQRAVADWRDQSRESNPAIYGAGPTGTDVEEQYAFLRTRKADLDALVPRFDSDDDTSFYAAAEGYGGSEAGVSIAESRRLAAFVARFGAFVDAAPPFEPKPADQDPQAMDIDHVPASSGFSAEAVVAWAMELEALLEESMMIPLWSGMSGQSENMNVAHAVCKKMRAQAQNDAERMILSTDLQRMAAEEEEKAAGKASANLQKQQLLEEACRKKAAHEEAARKAKQDYEVLTAETAVINAERKDLHERREKRKQRAERRAERRETIQAARRQAAKAHNVTIAQLQQNTSKAKAEAAAIKKRHAEETAADLPSVLARKSENLERLTGAVAYLKKEREAGTFGTDVPPDVRSLVGGLKSDPESVETGLSQAKSAIKTAIVARTAAAVEQLRKHDEEFQALEKQTDERAALVKRMQEAYAASKSPADGADLSG